MSRTLLTATAASLALIVGGATLGVSAAQAATEMNSQAATDLTKTSEDGFGAMRDIHLARLAIFDADADAARNLVADAQSKLAEEANDWDAYLSASGSDGALDKKYIVIDRTVGVAEDFLPSEEKSAAIDRANSHVGAGERTRVREELKLAGIDVTESQLLMPINTTLAHVGRAAMLLDQGSFYQANLALKAAEDGLVWDATDSYTPPDLASMPSN
jgi:hypothetical protein